MNWIITGNISENVKRSKVILRVHADDADSQLNSQIIYKLKSDIDGTFDIDKRSGSIRAIKPWVLMFKLLVSFKTN